MIKDSLLYELNGIDSLIMHKPIKSTEDMARIYSFLDRYIISILGKDILSVYKDSKGSIYDTTDSLMFLFQSEPTIHDFFINNNLLDDVYNLLVNMGNKKILVLAKDALNNSDKDPVQMTSVPTQEQVQRVFDALRRNFELYKRYYQNRIWDINVDRLDSTPIFSARIQISPARYFHLMGLDYQRLLKPSVKGGDNAKEFADAFIDKQKAYDLLCDFGKDKNIMELIERLLDSEYKMLQVAINGGLSNTVNFDKVEMKAYSFERYGDISKASGIVLFDQAKALSLGHRVGHITSDLILLSDFIRRYDINYGLDFVISPFKTGNGPQIRDQETIYVTKERGGGLKAGILDQQVAMISSSATGIYNPGDGTYSVNTGYKKGYTPKEQGDIEHFEYPVKERIEKAKTLVEAVPTVNTRYLEELMYQQGYENKHSRKKKN